MAVENVDTDKLKINLLTDTQYQDLVEIEQDELYVVNEADDNDDDPNILSSKTYADRGREAVMTQTTEPTSQYTQIWIDPDEAVVYITPASADMDNISETGSDNITAGLAPDFSKTTSYSQTSGNTFTVTKTGWLCVFVGLSSSLNLKKTDVSGDDIVDILTTSTTKTSDHILLEAGTTVYVNTRSGTVTLTYYPCKGLA